MTLSFRDPKDPDDVDDFTFNWTNVLGSETISSFTAVAVAGDATVGSTSNTTTTTTARISGGTAGTVADVRHRITTSGGRQLDRTMRIPIEVQ